MSAGADASLAGVGVPSSGSNYFQYQKLQMLMSLEERGVSGTTCFLHLLLEMLILGLAVRNPP